MYAKPVESGGKFFQFAFQVRVNPRALTDPERGGVLHNTIQNQNREVTETGWPFDLLIEPHISDNMVEMWITHSRDSQLVALMVRVLDVPVVEHYQSLAGARRRAGHLVDDSIPPPENCRVPRNFGKEIIPTVGVGARSEDSEEDGDGELTPRTLRMKRDPRAVRLVQPVKKAVVVGGRAKE